MTTPAPETAAGAAMRERLRATDLGEWLADPEESPPDDCGTQVIRYDEDSVIAFTEDETAPLIEEIARLKTRELEKLQFLSEGHKLDCPCQWCTELSQHEEETP